ncbi:MAG: universal stress protein [Desulfobacterales bacterium]|nr:MAG: universal stress protein [Desulfobacterales bacterium]
MIPQIKRILYATDLSQNSNFAFRYAINFAQKHNANIIILHVLEELSPSTRAVVDSFLSKEQRKKVFEERITHAMNCIKKRLETFYEKELQDFPASADRVESIEVCQGFPVERILIKADELDCDVIIMGTHGKGILSHTFLGSTARRLLRRVRKPVFVIPLPKGELDITVHDV